MTGEGGWKWAISLIGESGSSLMLTFTQGPKWSDEASLRLFWGREFQAEGKAAAKGPKEGAKAYGQMDWTQVADEVRDMRWGRGRGLDRPQGLLASFLLLTLKVTGGFRVEEWEILLSSFLLLFMENRLYSARKSRGRAVKSYYKCPVLEVWYFRLDGTSAGDKKGQVWVIFGAKAE